MISGYMKTLRAERRVDLIRAAASFPPHNQPFPEHALSKNPGKNYFFAVIFGGNFIFSNLSFLCIKTNVLVDFLRVRNQAVVQVQ